jgi:hypothetical protein
MDAYIVKAKEPTILNGQSHITLAGTDLWIGFRVSSCKNLCTSANLYPQVDTAYVVPGPIEIERFNDALSRTLSVYPAYAGRLERPRDTDQLWRVQIQYRVQHWHLLTDCLGSPHESRCAGRGHWKRCRGRSSNQHCHTESLDTFPNTQQR